MTSSVLSGNGVIWSILAQVYPQIQMVILHGEGDDTPVSILVFSPIVGMMIQSDKYVSGGLKPPTRLKMDITAVVNGIDFASIRIDR